MKTSLDEVLEYRKARYDSSVALIEKKGHDYNQQQQESGDTLFNLRVSELMGVVDKAERGVLVRLSDKFMRLQSLILSDEEPKVVEESIDDTIDDIHNYVDYLGLMRRKRFAGAVAATVTEATQGSDAAKYRSK